MGSYDASGFRGTYSLAPMAPATLNTGNAAKLKAMFISDLEKLESLSWFDEQTRVVVVETTLRNPELDRYVSVQYVFETTSELKTGT